MEETFQSNTLDWSSLVFWLPIKASSNILQEVVMEETKKTKLEIKVEYIEFL